MRAVRGLVVEDNEADATLIRETLESDAVIFELEVVGDGVAALEYLRRQPPYESAGRPDLILLDLNLPRLDGCGFLARLREDPEFDRIPVVVLTSSDADDDIHRSYELGANCYVTKPIGYREFRATVKSIEEFWFTVARLP